MRKVLIVLLAGMLLMGCQKSATQQQLQQIDSLLTADKVEKAYAALEKLEPESMRDDEDKAYYWLLRHESELRLQLFISSAKHLETSCSIFENHFEKDKMIRCYLCLSKIEASLHHKKEAYAWARLASFNFKKYHISKKLSGQLNLAMASFYQDQSNYDTALKYGRLALTDFYTEGSPREVQLSMMQLFMAYADKQMPDSADYYFKRSIEGLSHIPVYERATFYAAVGGWLTNTDTIAARHYLEKSLAIHPNILALQNIATLYHKQGKTDKAIEYWKEALYSTDNTIRLKVLKQLYTLQFELKDYESACQTAIHIVDLQDTINHITNNTNINTVEQEYDNTLHSFTSRFIFYIILYVTFIIALMSLGAFLMVNRRNNRMHKKYDDAISQIDRLRKLITALRQGEKTNKDETKTDRDVTPQQQLSLYNGQLLMEDIKKGGTTIRWTRSDFDDAVNYCHTLDSDFIDCLKARNPQFTSRNILFAYLDHSGFSDSQLRRAMAISQTTIRSYRSRIKQGTKAPLSQKNNNTQNDG